MGMYLNPGNEGFRRIRKSEYVDKSQMIALINQSIESSSYLTCVSRPRRFGKSYAAKMLCAYYDRSCDSSSLFEDLEIANDPTYEDYKNKFNVIYLDMTNIMGNSSQEGFLAFITDNISKEIHVAYPEIREANSLDQLMFHAVEYSGCKFIMIIDEWDAPIREVPQMETEYLRFLRTLFKSSGTTDKIFAAAYMTGILPIKKDGSQSAISDFREYTMLDSMEYAEFVGFTEEEVRSLCRNHGRHFDTMKQWYDGYYLDNIGSVYNPNSVMSAVRSGRFKSYWTQTSAADSLLHYIRMDYDGLQKTAAELLAGMDVQVNTRLFSNDLVTFKDRNDVLTLLIHLGYLTYDPETETARIPNEEIRIEFADSIRQITSPETVQRVHESDQLIADTINGNADAVAAQIEKIHREETTPLFYNREESLRSVVKLAYFSYKDQYLQFEELPAGDGFADILYLPKKHSSAPALLIELKRIDSAEGAMAQIKEKKYPEAILKFGGEILLVGISFDPKTKEHSCVIEPFKGTES